MSHTSRRGIECPLATLGRNTPSLDTQTYHHPLSSSPLNPQVYQMSRKSPIFQQEFEMYHLPNTQNIVDSQQPRSTRNHTEIESLLSFHGRLSPVVERETHPYTRNDHVVIVNHQKDEYLFNDKMDSLYINDDANLNSTATERYYLEHSLCSSNSLDNNSPNYLKRASSPSETSCSERYIIDRGARPSSSTISNFRNVPYNQPSTSVAQFDRFSPSLDQGYATLVSPSPSNQQVATPWNKKGVCRSGGFDRLSDEMVLKIFGWLDSCDLCNITRVCRRFESLVWNPVLWKNIKLKGDGISGDKVLKTIFRRLCGQTRNGSCLNVERVMLSEGCRVSDRGVQLLSRRCPELTHLQIQSSSTVTNHSLFDLATKCTNLQHLDITGCSQITTVNLNPGFDPPRRLLLQYLDLTDCCSINDEGLKTIVVNCPQLVYLYLRRCVQITDAGLKFVPSFCIALRELSVSDCSSITDFGIYELAKLGAALRYLSVAKCDQVSDAGLKVIARRCYKLRYLNARGCEAVSDDSITVLANSCPRLRALDIGKCDVSDAGLRALAESCPNLKKLSLKNCDMITDRGIQYIAYYCRGLQQLNIQDCQISLEGYRAVKRFCKRCVIEHTNPGFY
ncbi:F-box/LRR-repeat protein 7-like [Bradysia coprophila]|uniref:F-box/LRR-repeat protein 7-like n=1 Tax=Bradysia coprophila TaxID=38358 RepID=UPI00187DAA9E|nr:F-box/LRR-repeat protein 7-like [Bradysia coprophila]XP_037036988.1 F-box/LRR-repeat protein 7-like [Bradysia coprophila]